MDGEGSIPDLDNVSIIKEIFKINLVDEVLVSDRRPFEVKGSIKV